MRGYHGASSGIERCFCGLRFQSLATFLWFAILIGAGCSSQDFGRPVGRLGDVVDSGHAYVEEDDDEEAVRRAQRLARVLMAWEQQRGDMDLDYKIGADDVLAIGVLALDHPGEVSSLERSVSREGTVTLPLIGAVEAVGLTAMQLGERIAGKYEGKYLRDPEVTVRVAEYRSEPVVVTGMVASPGVYYLRHNQSSVLELLSQSGGLATTAGQELHIIRRGEDAAASTNAAAGSPEQLTPGLSTTQLVYEISIDGTQAVTEAEAPPESAHVVETTEDATVPMSSPPTNATEAAIETAGAPTDASAFTADASGEPGANPQQEMPDELMADTNIVEVVEESPFRSPPQIITVDLKQLLDRGDVRLNVPIYGGDIISVPPRKQEYVYVMGYVQAPGAFELKGKKEVAALQAVAMAGGLSGSARAQNSVLIRMTDVRREVIKVDLTKIARGVRPPVFMEPGDTLIVGSGFFARLGEFVRPSVGASASLSPVP